MIKKLLVSTTFFLTAIAAQATTLSGFYMDTVDPMTGGNTTVHWDDGSYTWANQFQVHIAPYQVLIDEAISGNYDPDLTIPNWITPVANGGATFAPVELVEIWGWHQEVLTTSMGNGVDLSFAHWPVIFFSLDQASWDVTLTPVKSVPEPETYAMLLAGLGVMGAMARRRKAKQA